MKIYIAGQITDNDDYMTQFKTAEEKLIKLGHAAEVIGMKIMFDE